MNETSNLGANEYSSLRDEILRADDQTVQLTGFAIVTASLVADAVLQAGTTRTKLFLLLGFNVVVLTLVWRVREKRGHQGCIAAYLRVFHEQETGWESRINELRKAPLLGQAKEPHVRETFSDRARISEAFVYAVLSLLAVVGSWLAILGPDVTTPDLPIGNVFHRVIFWKHAYWFAFVVQVVVCAAVGWLGWQSFGGLHDGTQLWQAHWQNLRRREREDLRHYLARCCRASNDLIVVNGPPASGKSTLVRSLADILRVKSFAKDGLKEHWYDQLEASGHVKMSNHDPGEGGLDKVASLPGRGDVPMDRGFLAELDQQTTEALLASAKGQLPCILDANLPQSQSGLLAGFENIVQIFIDADDDELRCRYDARRRHPVHVKKAETSNADIGGSQPLEIPGKRPTLIRVRSSSISDTLEQALTGLSLHYGLEPAFRDLQERMTRGNPSAGQGSDARQ